MPRVHRLALGIGQQELLERWSRGGSTPYRLVMRSQIILLAAAGYSNRNVARLLRINPITVARWRSRFLLLGIEGIRHDAPRLGSPPPVSEALVRTILSKTLYERPPNQSRWSTRSLARAVGVSHSTVRRIWKAHNVRPPRSRVARLALTANSRWKAIDLVGVYVNPPQRAVAISFLDNNRSGSRSPEPRLSPTVPNGSPNGRGWILDLVTTLDLLEKKEPKGSAHRLLDQEFLSFLHTVLERRRGQEQIHLLTESDGGTGPSALTRWLQRHPEFSARVQTRNAPLPQTVVEWLGDVSTQRPTREAPESLSQLRTAVEQWVRDTSNGPRPFAWTKERSGAPPADHGIL
jgi:transcriptional regulator with XRE-family HTH domain